MYALRESARAFEYDLDIRGIADPDIDTGVPGGRELIGFVDAVMGISGEDPDQARRRVIGTLDEPSLFDAATVYGNFEMMNRVAEATGIPVPAARMEQERETVETLGLDRFLKDH